MKNIRNFSIIAHIDHGKTTLSDRLLERTGALSQREMTEQFLDSMDLERERGITIKQHSVRLEYKAKDGQDYILNLIDTPGHVDFSYEVSRSLAACQGALLVVDASQGVEAQTLANAHLAVDAGLEIIPVLNKIDLPGAEPEKAKEQIEHVIGIDASGAILASAKQGIGIDEILEAIVDAAACAHGGRGRAAPRPRLRLLVRPVPRRRDPRPRGGREARAANEGPPHGLGRASTTWSSSGVFTPKPVPVDSLSAGEVGFVVAGIKKVSDTKIGDTLTDDRRPAPEPLPGFKEVKPMVFAGLYPVDADQYAELRDALEKLRLNDSSFFYEPETSTALGFGFRCGFLGLLHMEIVEERLEREFTLELLITAPSVRYRVLKTNGDVVEIDSPARLPDPGSIEAIEEPIITATILTGDEFVGAILKLCEEKRGVAEGPHVHHAHPRDDHVRAAPERDPPRLLRPAEVRVPGLRVARLRVHRLLGLAPREARRARERRAGGRALPHRPQGDRLPAREVARGEDAEDDPAADVRGGDPGRDRLPRHRARDREAPAQERASPSATAETSRASGSSSRSRRKARSG